MSSRSSPHPTAPDFFIVGAPKCGTTSLHYYLQQHPSLCLSNCSEPGYYTGESPAKDDEEYLQRFYPHCAPGTLRGEATTGYLRSQVAAERIHAANPRARIIVLTRRHVDALCSWHWQLARHRPIEQDMNAVLRSELEYHETQGASGVDSGYFQVYRFEEHIGTYRSLFGAGNVAAWDVGSLETRTAETLNEVCDFLGVETFDWQSADLSRKNTATRYSPLGLRVSQALVSALRVVPFAKRLPITLRMRVRDAIDRIGRRKLERPSIDPELALGIERYFSSDRDFLRDEFGIQW